MWWYFFTEVFDHFRVFFRGVFQVRTQRVTELSTASPIHIHCTAVPQVFRAFTGCPGAIECHLHVEELPHIRGYGIVGRSARLLPRVHLRYVHNESEVLTTELKHPLFSLTVHLYTAILMPLLHSLWLLTGAGNANFFYAATMVYGLNATLAVADVLGAIITRDVKGQLQRALGQDDGTQPVADLSIVQLASLE